IAIVERRRTHAYEYLARLRLRIGSLDLLQALQGLGTLLNFKRFHGVSLLPGWQCEAAPRPDCHLSPSREPRKRPAGGCVTGLTTASTLRSEAMITSLPVECAARGSGGVESRH